VNQQDKEYIEGKILKYNVPCKHLNLEDLTIPDAFESRMLDDIEGKVLYEFETRGDYDEDNKPNITGYIMTLDTLEGEINEEIDHRYWSETKFEAQTRIQCVFKAWLKIMFNIDIEEETK
jgi:hypothetical protein